MNTTPATMTLWGAYAKLEAVARAAELLALPGRIEIRERVESLLTRTELPKDTLAAELFAWRCEVGIQNGRTAAWLDEALFGLLDYLDLPEVHLSGAELLDHLVAGVGETDPDVTAARALYSLTSCR
jgi:hypothetical protein